jgi:hypothetical protein
VVSRGGIVVAHGWVSFRQVSFEKMFHLVYCHSLSRYSDISHILTFVPDGQFSFGLELIQA